MPLLPLPRRRPCAGDGVVKPRGGRPDLWMCLIWSSRLAMVRALDMASASALVARACSDCTWDRSSCSAPRRRSAAASCSSNRACSSCSWARSCALSADSLAKVSCMVRMAWCDGAPPSTCASALRTCASISDRGATRGDGGAAERDFMSFLICSECRCTEQNTGAMAMVSTRALGLALLPRQQPTAHARSKAHAHAPCSCPQSSPCTRASCPPSWTACPPAPGWSPRHHPPCP